MSGENSGNELHNLQAVVTAVQVLGWVQVDGVRVLGVQLMAGAPHGPADPVVLGLTPEATEELLRLLELEHALETGSEGPPVQ